MQNWVSLGFLMGKTSFARAKNSSRLREHVEASGQQEKEPCGKGGGAAGKKKEGPPGQKKRFITSTFTKDHSIHYYLGPLQLNYGGLMGSGVLCRV